MKKRIIIIAGIASLLIVAAVLAFAANMRFANGKIYTLDPSYAHIEPLMGSCMAMMPECGVCVNGDGEYGIVENNICYLPL